MRLIKFFVKRVLTSCGYQLVKLPRRTVETKAPAIVAFRETSNSFPQIGVSLGTPKQYAKQSIVFSVDNGRSVLQQEVLYSSLTLLKMLKHFHYDTVLDIGSHAGNVTRIFQHLGKQVTTIEISPGYQADYKDDYLDVASPKQFDAIWCSQILEHQRNVGLFLNKVFDDLKENGVLAITVPEDIGQDHLAFGHCNMFSALLIIYHLVMAGFDCSQLCLKRYEGNIGVILRKRYNNINRYLPQGTLPATEATSGTVNIEGKQWSWSELLGEEIFPGMRDAFPPEIALSHVTRWNGDSINWGNPI